jgi:hypothetical protein
MVRASIQASVVKDIQVIVDSNFKNGIRQEELATLTVSVSDKYSLNLKQTEFMIRVVECEISFLLEIGKRIR